MTVPLNHFPSVAQWGFFLGTYGLAVCVCVLFFQHTCTRTPAHLHPAVSVTTN